MLLLCSVPGTYAPGPGPDESDAPETLPEADTGPSRGQGAGRTRAMTRVRVISMATRRGLGRGSWYRAA